MYTLRPNISVNELKSGISTKLLKREKFCCFIKCLSTSSKTETNQFVDNTNVCKTNHIVDKTNHMVDKTNHIVDNTNVCKTNHVVGNTNVGNVVDIG